MKLTFGFLSWYFKVLNHLEKGIKVWLHIERNISISHLKSTGWIQLNQLFSLFFELSDSFPITSCFPIGEGFFFLFVGLLLSWWHFYNLK
jgi:hypothetical protein